MKKVNDFIRAQRVKKGLSQEYMATVLGRTQTWYSLLEAGKSKLNFEDLKKIIKILDINPIEIIRLLFDFECFISCNHIENFKLKVAENDTLREKNKSLECVIKLIGKHYKEIQ